MELQFLMLSGGMFRWVGTFTENADGPKAVREKDMEQLKIFLWILWILLNESG